MPATTITMEVEIDIEVEFYITSKGSPDYFDRRAEQYYPGDHSQVEITSVTIVRGTQRIDALGLLSGGDLNRITEYVLEEVAS